jgi:hypothetical protein
MIWWFIIPILLVPVGGVLGYIAIGKYFEDF